MGLKDLLQRQFGVRTRPILNRLVTTVGTTVAMILPVDSNRLAFVLVNLSAVPVYVLPAPDVSSIKAILLAAGGGSLIVIFDQDFDLTGWEWYGLSSSGTVNILTLEIVQEFSPAEVAK